MKKYFSIIVIIVLFNLSGCAQHSVTEIIDPPGFWYGLLHGFIILFSFIGSLFQDIRIYAFPNSGLWYDLGFLIGASAFLSGSCAGGRTMK
ncbi:MAG: hypothetical protein ACYC09_09830 [Bacteroidota bacterium]